MLFNSHEIHTVFLLLWFIWWMVGLRMIIATLLTVYLKNANSEWLSGEREINRTQENIECGPKIWDVPLTHKIFRRIWRWKTRSVQIDLLEASACINSNISKMKLACLPAPHNVSFLSNLNIGCAHDARAVVSVRSVTKCNY